VNHKFNGDGFPAFEMYYTGNWSKVVYGQIWYADPKEACLAPILCDWSRAMDAPIL
jgi:hypothetical protein